jgi:VWFA-related protein
MPQEKKKDNPKSGQDVVKLRAELVQIDVAVSDRNNRPVIGLKREDFELYDNNKLQTITHFSLEESTSTALRIEDDIETPRSLPRAITATELKRVFAFVVDTMHMKPENVYRARATLQDFLDKKMEPGDLVLILATAGGSGVFQQFTSDQRILRAAVARLRPFTLSSATTPFRSIGRSSTIGMPGRPSGPGFAGIDPFEEADARATLGTLNNMIRAMSTLPGRKISVFISEGFRLFSTRTSQDLDETIARAARANVVFYSIDPRGLDPLSLNASDDLGDEDLGSFLSRKRDDFRESQDSLNALAVDTGGKFFRNNNDIKQMLNSLIDGSSSYYLLGFQPADEKWDGKYHKIKVVVRNRPELRVSTRKGYLARSEPRRVYSDPKVGEMVEAINSPLVRRDIDLQLTPFYRDDAKRQVNLLSLLHIDATRLKFKEVDGKFATKLDLVGFILGPNGTPIDRFSNTVELNLKPETHKEILKRGLLSTRTTTVKAGIYQVRMFVRETDSGLIGTANNYVEIPDLKGDRLATSSIFLDPRYDAQGQKADDVGSSETLSQRRYRPGRQFGYALVVYNAKAEGKTNQPQLEVRTRILSSGRAAYDGKYHPVQIAEGSTPPSRIMTGGVMQLGALPRGEYTLEVTVKDKLVKKESRGFVRQEIDFSIE